MPQGRFLKNMNRRRRQFIQQLVEEERLRESYLPAKEQPPPPQLPSQGVVRYTQSKLEISSGQTIKRAQKRKNQEEEEEEEAGEGEKENGQSSAEGPRRRRMTLLQSQLVQEHSSHPSPPAWLTPNRSPLCRCLSSTAVDHSLQCRN